MERNSMKFRVYFNTEMVGEAKNLLLLAQMPMLGRHPKYFNNESKTTHSRAGILLYGKK